MAESSSSKLPSNKLQTIVPSSIKWQPHPRESTILLVGKTGVGKSATGNSIVGRKVFSPSGGAGGVTESCATAKVSNNFGITFQVIDTPGLFDLSEKQQEEGKQVEEMTKCIELAKDGIDVLVLVYSIRSRFSAEEYIMFQWLENLFGKKVRDHLVIVFTGGDELRVQEKSFDEYLDSNTPIGLQNIIKTCGRDKMMPFDNRATDSTEKQKQVHNFFSIVEKVMAKTKGIPYAIEIFEGHQIERKLREDAELLLTQLEEEKSKHVAEIAALKQLEQARAKHAAEITRLKQLEIEMVESTNIALFKQLENEKAERVDQINLFKQLEKEKAETTQIAQFMDQKMRLLEEHNHGLSEMINNLKKGNILSRLFLRSSCPIQ